MWMAFPPFCDEQSVNEGESNVTFPLETNPLPTYTLPPYPPGDEQDVKETEVREKEEERERISKTDPFPFCRLMSSNVLVPVSVSVPPLREMRGVFEVEYELAEEMLMLVRVSAPSVSTAMSEWSFMMVDAMRMENSFIVASFWMDNVVPLLAILDWTVKVTEAYVDPES